MAQISSKIAPFPGCLDKRPAPSAGEVPATQFSDPTKELRAYIEGLQNEARQARLHQESAEEDRDRLAEEVRRLQLELEAANEARKEVRAVVVERDNLRAALEKNEVILVEVRRRVDAAERQRAQADSQRDQAMRLYKETRKEADQHRAARDESNRQRDAALRQRQQALKEQEEVTARAADLQRQIGELQRALVEAQSGASKMDVQKQLMSIRQARDFAAAQAAELKMRIGELEDTIAELTYDRDVSDKATRTVLAEMEQLRLQADADAEKAQLMETLKAELAEINQELTALREQHASVQGAKEQLVAQLREFRDTHEAQLISNTSHLESATKERDVLKARLQEREAELQEVRAELASTWASAMQVTEPEIERLTTEVETMKSRAAEIDAVIARAEEMTRQREEMRLQVIELNAQLENARREIKEIGAQLAEARLQLKLAAKNPSVPWTVSKSPPAGASDPSAAASRPADRFAALRSAHAAWIGSSGDPTPLWDLAREAAAFSGSCQAAGEKTLHRLAKSLATLLESLLDGRVAATPRAQALAGRTIEVLNQLERSGAGLDQSVRLSGARAYVVEHDSETREQLARALEGAGMVVESAEHPSGAIAHLAGQFYDLILIDVALPEIDGFELCGYVRGMENHAGTPIIFLAETDGAENGLGESEVVTKPFTPEELELRASLTIVQSQLQLA